ncbi:MAG: nuclear transport factor 2 family protein [Gammaproteobacteria bacterium]|nr:nuclear transport factor 2 family protein [Gammaproteobacteria bacterium]
MAKEKGSQNDGPADALPAWGHRHGLLDLGAEPAPGAATPELLLDRQLIGERALRYCWYYDERRLELLADCFCEDAVWEGLVMGIVSIGPFEGREKIAGWLSEFWPHQHDQRRHMVLNTIVQSHTAEYAETCSYILLSSANMKRVSVETTGFYRLHLARETDAWRIKRFTAGFDFPFWPGALEELSERGKARHGISNYQPGK